MRWGSVLLKCEVIRVMRDIYLWNMQLQTTSPESKFPNKYSDVIFIQIDQHLKVIAKIQKGPDFPHHGVVEQIPPMCRPIVNQWSTCNGKSADKVQMHKKWCIKTCNFFHVTCRQRKWIFAPSCSYHINDEQYSTNTQWTATSTAASLAAFSSCFRWRSSCIQQTHVFTQLTTGSQWRHRHKHSRQQSEWVSEKTLNSSTAQLGYTVPFTLVHTGNRGQKII